MGDDQSARDRNHELGANGDKALNLQSQTGSRSTAVPVGKATKEEALPPRERLPKPESSQNTFTTNELDQYREQDSRTEERIQAYRDRAKRYRAETVKLRERSKMDDERRVEMEAELEALKGFLSTYEDASASDVRRLLETVNDRTEHVACQNTHLWLAYSPGDTVQDQSLPEARRVDLLETLGSPFVVALQGCSPKSDDALFLLQAAWQACITDGARQVLETASKDVGGGSETERSVSRIVDAAQRGEVQHCRKRSNVAASKFQCPEYGSFEASLGHQVEEVFLEAEKLAEMVRERIVSADFRPYAPHHRSQDTFDEAIMSLSDGGPESVGAALDNSVLCTTRLGMSRKYKPVREHSATVRNELFVKPQVLTQKCLDDLLHPDPTS